MDSNYTISYAPGTVTDQPAPLTITASNGTMTYGGTVPTITAGLQRLRERRHASSLTTQPTCSTTATSSSPVAGPRTLLVQRQRSTPTTPSATSAGAVTVNTAPLTITASSPTMTYGGTVAGDHAAYTGFVNGDTASSLTTAADLLDHGHQPRARSSGSPYPILVQRRGRTRTTPSAT